MAKTEDGFEYPGEGDWIKNSIGLNGWFKKLALSIQAFVNSTMGSRIRIPTGISAPDASAKSVAFNGVVTFTDASKISLDGIFDWDDQLNYEIVFQFNEIYSDTSFGFRVRSGGDDDSDPHYGFTRTRAYNDNDGDTVGKTAVYTTTKDNETVVTPETGSGNFTTAFGTIRLFKVRNATRLHGIFQSATNYTFHIQTATGAFALDPKVDKFDGFTIFPKVATQFSGTVRVQAFN